MAQRAAFIRVARAHGVRIMLTGADAPAAWKSGNRLRQGMEARYGDYLIAWAERLRAVGARGDYLAAGNEISNPDYFNMSGDQAALVYRRLARRIRADHLSIRLAIGTTRTSPTPTVTARSSFGILSSRATRRSSRAMPTTAWARAGRKRNATCLRSRGAAGCDCG